MKRLFNPKFVSTYEATAAIDRQPSPWHLHKHTHIPIYFAVSCNLFFFFDSLRSYKILESIIFFIVLSRISCDKQLRPKCYLNIRMFVDSSSNLDLIESRFHFF